MLHYRDSLVKVIRSVRGKHNLVAEVGVHRGRTSEHLLRSFPQMTLWMVDPWAEYDEANAYNQAQYRAETIKRIGKLNCGERAKIVELPSVEAAAIAPEMDLVFIDAEHSYEAVLADCRAWWPKIKSGGILCGHDFGKELGVDQAVLEFAAEVCEEVQAHSGHIWSLRKDSIKLP